MAERTPWVTPQEVRDYTEYPSVKQRSDAKLAMDISLAEAYVIGYTNNRFSNEDFPTGIPESVKTAVILIAEMYAFNASLAAEGVGAYQSEAFDDYSYTMADIPKRLDNIILGPLLDDFIIKEAKDGQFMRLRKL